MVIVKRKAARANTLAGRALAYIKAFCLFVFCFSSAIYKFAAETIQQQKSKKKSRGLQAFGAARLISYRLWVQNMENGFRSHGLYNP